MIKGGQWTLKGQEFTYRIEINMKRLTTQNSCKRKNREEFQPELTQLKLIFLQLQVHLFINCLTQLIFEGIVHITILFTEANYPFYKVF